jgi:hypothetical protein
MRFLASCRNVRAFHELTAAGRLRRLRRMAQQPGYERLQPWPERMNELLPHLIAARRLAMANLAVVLDRPGLTAYLRGHADRLRTYPG